MSDDLQSKLCEFGFDDASKAKLRRAGEILIEDLDGVLSRFYERALASPTASGFFKSQDRVQYARDARKKHWMRLLRAIGPPPNMNDRRPRPMSAAEVIPRRPS